MAKPFKEPCPHCGRPIEGKITGWFSKRLLLPNLCGNCKQNLYQACPNCQTNLLHLTNYCPNCNQQLYKPSKPQTKAFTSITDQQKKFLKQLRTDAQDLKSFYFGFFRTIVRRNPVNLQINQFIEIMNQIEDNPLFFYLGLGSWSKTKK
jgi:rRNA maturation protein Nop10